MVVNECVRIFQKLLLACVSVASWRLVRAKGKLSKTNVGWGSCFYVYIQFEYPPNFLPSKQLYSPGCTLASCTICLQASRFLALSLHLLTPIFLRSVDTSCGHLILGLPLCLAAYSFLYSIFFRIAVSFVLSICPSHRILWHLINQTIYILQTGLYIFSRNLGTT
jgi:hypothetical protein